MGFTVAGEGMTEEEHKGHVPFRNDANLKSLGFWHPRALDLEPEEPVFPNIDLERATEDLLNFELLLCCRQSARGHSCGPGAGMGTRRVARPFLLSCSAGRQGADGAAGRGTSAAGSRRRRKSWWALPISSRTQCRREDTKRPWPTSKTEGRGLSKRPRVLA